MWLRAHNNAGSRRLGGSGSCVDRTVQRRRIVQNGEGMRLFAFGVAAATGDRREPWAPEDHVGLLADRAGLDARAAEDIGRPRPSGGTTTGATVTTSGSLRAARRADVAALERTNHDALASSCQRCAGWVAPGRLAAAPLPRSYEVGPVPSGAGGVRGRRGRHAHASRARSWHHLDRKLSPTAAHRVGNSNLPLAGAVERDRGAPIAGLLPIELVVLDLAGLGAELDIHLGPAEA